MLPIDSKARKEIPMFTGLLKYFPDALAAVAHHSFVNNEKHNPGEPLHWAREKSTDQDDTIIRHMTDIAAADTSDNDKHYARKAVAWRALAALQLDIERRSQTVTDAEIEAAISSYAAENGQRDPGDEDQPRPVQVGPIEKRETTHGIASTPTDPGDRAAEEMSMANRPEANGGPYVCERCKHPFHTPRGLAAHRMGREGRCHPPEDRIDVC